MSPQMIGVEPDHSGIASFQVMFSVFDHLTGRFVSRADAVQLGDRATAASCRRRAAPTRG